MAVDLAYSPINEILDFLLTQPTLDQVIALHASDVAQERLRTLLDGNRNATLNDTERAELDAYLQLDKFVLCLKVRARLKLSASL